MNVPEKLEFPLVVKDTDGDEHEVERLVYRLERDDKSRWAELFGTPERAARTLANVCRFTHGGELCDRCQCYLFDSCDRTLRLGSEQKIYDALLDWLKGVDE